MNRGEFARHVFTRLSIPINGKTLTFAVAWAAYEDTLALNNPWATTEPFGDSTDFNSVGVKNYDNWADGVDATIMTLENGDYNQLLKTLRNANSSPRQMLNALNAAPWGSHPNTSLFELVSQHYDEANIEVPGSGDSSTPAVEQPKENIVAPLYEKNEDGTFTEVADETTAPSGDVPEPLESDTLEDRQAKADAFGRGLTLEQAKAEADAAVVASASTPATEDFKAQLTTKFNDFLDTL